MIMKKLLLIFPIIIFMRCKKDTINTSCEITPPINNNVDYIKLNGLFDIVKKNNLTGTVLGNDYGFSTFKFSSIEMLSDSISNYCKDYGIIKINSIVLKKINNTSTLYYYDTTNTYLLSPFTINTTHTLNANSFNFSFNGLYPSYTGYTILTNSIVLSSGCSIKINNYANCDDIEVIIRDNVGVKVKKNMTNKDSLINFSSNDLYVFNFSTVPYVEIEINFRKNAFNKINDLKYNFRLIQSISKKNVNLY